MRQLFGALLVLLMLMPSLACAMPVCPPFSTSSASVEKPCHGHEESEKKSDHVRFIIDCMGVDLQKADAAHFEKGDLRTILLDFPLIDNAVASQNINSGPQIIRGPPPDWLATYQSHASIILTTQRLRI